MTINKSKIKNKKKIEKEVVKERTIQNYGTKIKREQ
jgi:hypothetical protein